MFTRFLTHKTRQFFFCLAIAVLALGPESALAGREAIPRQKALAPAEVGAPYHMWSKQFGCLAYFSSYDVATDEAGDVFLTGTFSGSVDFGGGFLESTGVYDTFLAKYDSDGNHLWSKRFGSTQGTTVQSLDTDPDGNVLITGSFEDNVDFGGGALISAGQADIFLAKYDGNGNHLWSKAFGETQMDWGLSLTTDAEGSIFVTGYFHGSVDFGGGNLISNGEEDVFLAKYDANGNYLWAKDFGSFINDHGTAIAIDAVGNVFLTGIFSGRVDFGGGELTSTGIPSDIFLAKYDTNGIHLWSWSIGGESTELIADLAANAVGDIYATGYFQGSVDFGGGPLVSAGDFEIFLAKYSPDGDQLWSKRFGNTGSDIGYGLSINEDGDVIVTGQFVHSVDFGGGIFTSAPLSWGDMFLAGYNATGEHLWSKHLGDESGVSSSFVNGDDVVIDSAGSIFVTGGFRGSVDFGGGALVSPLNEPNIFLAKFGGGGSLRPGIFNKGFPLNGATGVSTSPTLTWGTSSSVSLYEYCYDDTDDDTCSTWTSTGITTSIILSDLNLNTTYYWHIRAVNNYGTTYSNGGLPAAFWSFTTGAKPEGFNKATPTNGAIGVSTSPTLAWEASSGATSYEYCYDNTDDDACSTWISTLITTSTVLNDLNPNTSYYWHVRAVNSFGTTYSDGDNATNYWSFTTHSKTYLPLVIRNP